MKTYIVSEDYLTDIADAIRDKTGSSDGIEVNEMPDQIRSIGDSGGSGNGDGATFIPSVDADGNLSWTNDKGLDNPEPVNIKGSQGTAGKDGNDGVSPTVSVTDITGGHRITITDANGTKTVDVMDGGDGQDGQDGSNGKDGNGIKSAVLNADYTLTLTFDDGTSYTTPSIRGATGQTGSAGEAGHDGQPGEDGVGIASIQQTTTSTADGGNNVFTVTLTNGTSATFTVKNGSKGSVGNDYVITDTDKAELLAEVRATANQQTPLFANSISECTDTSKVYVLPDGYIYAYVSQPGALFTNQIANAINTDGTPYNGGLGYESGYWLKSDGALGSQAGCVVTGYIPISNIANIVLRASGFTGTLTDNDSMKFYNSSFANIKLDNNDRLNTNVAKYGGIFADEAAFDGAVKTFTFDYQAFKAKSGWYSSQLSNGKPAYVRFSLYAPDLEKMVVTINEEIAFGTLPAWKNTGHQFVPADYEDRILDLENSAEDHEDRISALEMYGSESTSAEDIPAYIKTEADDVMSRVIDSQGNRSFTLVAISDFHYSGAGDNKDNLIRASKAISYITDRIHVDAVATLGDNLPYGSAYDTTIRATADRWSKEINEILAITQKPGIVDFRTPGNHDRFGTPALYMPDNAIYSFISGYNRQCDYVDVPGGWAYRDFPGYKLRVIVLNTAETEGQGRFSIHSGFHMSAKQYEWLIDTLNISDKANASDWQILVLSHHKADDWQVAATNATANNYILPNILNAYDTGGSYTGVNAEDGKTISCNFAGKNSAKLIGQIHGHHHAYIYGNLCLAQGGTETNVMAISTPTSGFGTGSGHNDDNAGNYYDSIKNTADETAFCVYSIDLDNHIVNAIHYGNGIDREIPY